MSCKKFIDTLTVHYHSLPFWLTAPAISIVDKAIVSNASGVEPLVPCLINGIKTFFTNPVYFVKQPSFLLIWGVYGGTYIVANSIEVTFLHFMMFLDIFSTGLFVCQELMRKQFSQKFMTSLSCSTEIGSKCFLRSNSWLFGTRMNDCHNTSPSFIDTSSPRPSVRGGKRHLFILNLSGALWQMSR